MQSNSVETDDPCAGYGQVCRWVEDWIDIDWMARLADRLLVGGGRVLLIIFVALVVRRTAHGAIGRFQRRLRALSVQPEEVGEPPRGDFVAWSTALQRRVLQREQRAMQRSATLGMVLRALVTAVIGVLAVLLILGELGLNLAPLIAGAGVAGIALGFGAQSIVKDFLSGLFMLAEDQFGVGDIIDVGEATGVVEGVTLRSTRIRDVNGTLWHVPNGEIRRVGNKSQLWARTILDVHVAYDTDLERVTALIAEVANGIYEEQPEGRRIIEPPEVWGLEDFGADAVVIRLAVKTEPAQQFNTARELRARLKVALDEAGIEIPFPQRTVWLRAEPGDAPNSVPETGDDPRPAG